MNTSRFALAVAALCALGQMPSTAPGQTQAPPPRDATYGGSAPATNTTVVGGGGWGGGYHSSTAAGDAMQGMASAISAKGEANLNNSMAARNMEEAYSRALDNRAKHIETYRWREDSAKQIQQQQMAEHRAEMEPWLAKQRLQPLTTAQFDQTSGVVEWPKLCLDPRYDKYRNRLNELFQKRSQYGALSMDEFTEVENLIKDWRGAITADSRTENWPSGPVSQALRFLLSLNRELNAQFG
jgi:hypothetical protein